MLSSAIPAMQKLHPQYIRIDHIFDYYVTIEKQPSQTPYDFSQLDKTVADILSMGALPFFSLSYMPKIFTKGQSVTEEPANWQDWSDLVAATIERYSGKKNSNLTNVYYEVWNEPELTQFGTWSLTPTKDYRLLYFHTVLGANAAQDTNRFFIGGPSVGSYYASWVTDFLTYVQQNNLRLDFYSWHRYTSNPTIYRSDAINIRNRLSRFPTYKDIPLILSEWGLDSNNTEQNNSNKAAVFTLAAAKNFLDSIDTAFAFEVKDGPPPNGGKWGLITHEKSLSPLTPKPRYYAFQSLGNLTGNILPVGGEGSFVSAIATVENGTYHVLLYNYDFAGKNTENVPITFSNLPSGQYRLTYTYPLTGTEGTYDDTVTTNTFTRTFPLPSNDFVLLQLSTVSKFADFARGSSGKPDDFSLSLQSLKSPFTYTSTFFHLEPIGSIDFDLQPLWKAENGSFYVFEIPYSSQETVHKIALSKQTTSNGTFLVLNTTEAPDQKISLHIDGWEKNSWHHIQIKWNTEGLFLTIDNKNSIQIPVRLTIQEGKTFTIPSSPISIDNLIIRMNGKIILERHFDNGPDS